MKWLKNLFDKYVNTEKTFTIKATIVYLRTLNEVPAQLWKSRVYYDAWGSPYVKGWPPSTRRNWGMRKDGTVDASIYKVYWKHKSGPEIVWPKESPPQKNPFNRDP